MKKILIASVVALSVALVGASVANAAFNANLTVGSTGADVSALQSWLISKGFNIPSISAGAAQPGYFGQQTKAAVTAYQAANGIPNTGFFGPLTRASVNAGGGVGMPTLPSTGCPVGFICTPQPGSNPSTPTGALQGGAGSIEDADFVSGVNNEEVGEDADDVEVAGLEIEADDGSDIMLSAVRLDFDQSTGATADFEDYASDVSIWVNGKEVARVDADEFNDDNNFDKTISLSSNVIKAGARGKLMVKVSGISNLDSTEATDLWTIIFSQVRFMDAQGVSITETATGDIGTESRVLSFESFATAADTEFKITEGDDDINDSHIIVVDSSNDTDDVPILAFNVEVEGTADLSVDALPVGVLVATNDNIDDMISGLTLWMDGKEVGSANISDCIEDSGCSALGTYEPFLFDDLGLTLQGGEEYEFVVKADFYSTDASDTGDLTAGDSISASTTAALIEIGALYADIEDESGEDLTAGDISGSASSDSSAVYVSGILPKFVSANETVREGSIAGDPDVVDLEIVFDITAIGDDEVWVEGDFATSGAVASAAVDGQFWATTTDSNTGTSTTGVTKVGTPTLSANGSNSDDDTTSSTRDFHLDSGETRRFTFRVSIPAGDDNVNAGARITGIKWGTLDSDDTMNNLYTFNISDLRTDTVTGLVIH